MDEEAVAAVARLMLDRVAGADPAVAAEVPLFPVLSAAYFRDRERSLSGAANGGSLRFGFDEAILLMTPLLLEVARKVGEHLTEEAASRGVHWTGEMVRRALGREPESPSLTAEQWEHVHAIVTEVLTGPGEIPAERAELLADAVVGRGRLDDGAE